MSRNTPALSRTYTWGTDLSGTMQGAGGVGGLLAVRIHVGLKTGNYYPTFDGNGNVSEYVDTGGEVQVHFEYDPFGNVTALTEKDEDLAAEFNYRFSTKPFDDVSGWYYYGYRYYDPHTGRWSSRDPIGEEGGRNLFAFVENHAINNYDILGNISKEECQKRADELFAKDPQFIAITKLMQEQGCPRPSYSCQDYCPEPMAFSTGVVIHRGDRKARSEIYLSVEWMKRRNRTLREVLLHEFIHTLQICTGKANMKTPCETSLCMEVEAYSRANCAHAVGEKAHKDCVKGKYGLEKVGYSSKFACTEQEFNDKFDDIYEKCKKLHSF